MILSFERLVDIEVEISHILKQRFIILIHQLLISLQQ